MPEYPAWRCLTADAIVNKGPTELLYAYLEPSAANADATLYDGFGTQGRKITTILSSTKTSRHFAPPDPIICEKGLYLDVGSNVTSVLVMFKPIRERS